MDLNDLYKLAGIQKNDTPAIEPQPVEQEVTETPFDGRGDMKAMIALISPEQLNQLVGNAPVEEEGFANSGDEYAGEPEEFKGTLGSPADLSLRRYLGANGQPVKMENVYADHKVEDITEAWQAYKVDEGEMPAGLKAYHDKKKKKSGDKEATDEGIEVKIHRPKKKPGMSPGAMGGKVGEDIEDGEETKADVKKDALELLVDIAKTSRADNGEITKDQTFYLGNLIHDFDALHGIEEEKYSEIVKLFKTMGATERAGMTDIQPAYAQAKTLDEATVNEEPNEGNEFSGELAKAKAAGKKEFKVGDKTYKVEGSGMDLNRLKHLSGMSESPDMQDDKEDDASKTFKTPYGKVTANWDFNSQEYGDFDVEDDQLQDIMMSTWADDFGPVDHDNLRDFIKAAMKKRKGMGESAVNEGGSYSWKDGIPDQLMAVISKHNITPDDAWQMANRDNNADIDAIMDAHNDFITRMELEGADTDDDDLYDIDFGEAFMDSPEYGKVMTMVSELCSAMGMEDDREECGNGLMQYVDEGATAESEDLSILRRNAGI